MLPEGCIVKVIDGLYVSSPEMCFFQMAAELSLVKKIELGFEFCGTYSLLIPGFEYQNPEVEKRGFGNRNNAITSKKKLEALLARMVGRCGQRPHTKTLRYLIDGSASPMETVLTMLLTLPHKYGGYGLPLPELNKPRVSRVSDRKSTRNNVLNKSLRCDLEWPAANVAVEYDSDTYHTGPQRIAKDSIRRNQLTTSGKRIITVTKDQVYDETEFDTVARQIAENLGWRLRDNRSEGFSEARSELRFAILPKGR